MSIFKKDIPLEKAKEIVYNSLREANLAKVLGREKISVDENAVGRILAEPVMAKFSSPSYNSSAMDGFAINTKDVEEAKITKPVLLNYEEQTIYVDTGDPIPERFNAVIPIEECEALDENGKIALNQRKPKYVRIRSSFVPWQNVRFLGEDITKSQLLFVSGSEITPVDLGVIAASGHTEIEVARKPRVAIIPTGSELVPVGTQPKVGQILEFNSLVLATKVNKWGGASFRAPIVKDKKKLIREKLKNLAGNHDLILIIAGSSAGSEDFTSEVISETGNVLFHGIAVRPGHPVIMGMVERDSRRVPVIGVPGFPVSAALTMDLFVRELIYLWTGRSIYGKETISAKITRKVTSPAGDDDFVRVSMARVGEEILAIPLSRGAGVLTSLSQADGIVKIASGIQGLEEGMKINVELQRNKSDIFNSILCMGSHDLVLEKLTSYLAIKKRRFLSINVGSLGGLFALDKGYSHLAGSHLLDGATGEYNFSYINKYIINTECKVISLAIREQGLLIKKGNPKRIKSINDLLREDVTFINRQRGSGTRILLDFKLTQSELDSKLIQGYEQEEYTHLGIASAIVSGRADCGLGIAEASNVYELDFIPLFDERYDLIINKAFADSQLLEPLFSALSDKWFIDSLIDLKGYKFHCMGEVLIE
ncbi:molybdopterin biosynthesis protein [Chloroflexota bacterium]